MLKNKRLTLDDQLIANDVLLSGTTDHAKHQDVRDIELSDSDGDPGNTTKLGTATSTSMSSSSYGDSEEDKGDLDTFIEGVLDVIGSGKAKKEESEDDDRDDAEAMMI